MEKIIERNVPIAEENVTLSGQPATNMFEDWSENITETDLLHEEKDKGFSPKKNPKKLMKGHYKIFCVNGNTGFRNESRIFYFIHLQNEEAYERKESSSA